MAMKAKDTGLNLKVSSQGIEDTDHSCLALLGPHLEYVFSFPCTKQRFMNYSKSRRGASRVGRWLDGMSCKEKLQELGLSSPKKGET